MIFDSHVHIADAPDEGGFRVHPLDAEGLLRLMDGPFLICGDRRRVDRALTQPMISLTRTGHPADHHRYVLRQVQEHADRFVGCFVANPLLDTDETIAAMRDLIGGGAFRAVKLHPTSHGYMPFKTRDRIDPIVAEARRLNVPILVHQGDPPFGHPSQMSTIIEDFPGVTFILSHFGTQRVVLADEAIYVARKNPNVYLETGWGDLPRIKEGLAVLGPRRLLFWSDCPVQEIGSQLRVLEVLTWDPPIGIRLTSDDLERIMGGNAATLFGVRDS